MAEDRRTSSRAVSAGEGIVRVTVRPGLFNCCRVGERKGGEPWSCGDGFGRRVKSHPGPAVAATLWV